MTRDSVAEYRNPSTSDGAVTVRTSAPPPMKVALVDLTGLHTTAGIKLGSPAAAVSRVLGKPYVARACGIRRYAYTRNRAAEPTLVEFRIRAGRVTEIYEEFGG